MKRRAVFFLLVIILFSGLVFWAAHIHSEENSQASSFKEETREKKNVRNSLLFQKEEKGDVYSLTYGWKGFQDVSYLFSFEIAKDEVMRSEAEVGYIPEDMNRNVEEGLRPLRLEMIGFLRAFVEEEIQKSSWSRYFIIKDAGEMSFNIKISAPPSAYGDVKAEFLRITRELGKYREDYQKKINKKQKDLMDVYLEKHGLRFYGKKIGVNYGNAVRANRSRVKSVMQKLLELGKRNRLNDFLSMSLSFIQKIAFGIPPLKDGQKITLSFWVPLKVLVSNFGDCDSKSVTFASIWLNFRRYPLMLIKIPNHMFVGIAIPVSSESGVMINGLRYTLLEVAGPEIFPPGLLSSYSRMYLESGRFTYEIIR